MKLRLAAYIVSEDWRKKYDYVSRFHEGFARVRLNDKYGFVNTEGVEVVPLKYDGVWAFHDGLAKVLLNRKQGFINTKGEVVIPLKYDYVGDFQGGFAEVELNDKWGFVNKEGVEIVPPKYTEENVKAIPKIVRLLALRRNISKEEALKLALEEMAK